MLHLCINLFTISLSAAWPELGLIGASRSVHAFNCTDNTWKWRLHPHECNLILKCKTLVTHYSCKFHLQKQKMIHAVCTLFQFLKKWGWCLVWVDEPELCRNNMDLINSSCDTTPSFWLLGQFCCSFTWSCSDSIINIGKSKIRILGCLRYYIIALSNSTSFK